LDGQNFTSTGSVQAANTGGVHQYNFTDPGITSLGAAVIYYRLKQVDLDGSYDYSNIVTLTIDMQKRSITLYPNPVQNSMNLLITWPQREKWQWQLVDDNGRVVKYGRYDISAGTNLVTENIGILSSGVYFMQINGPSWHKVIKVVKQ
jgi:hypothetical protein